MQNNIHHRQVSAYTGEVLNAACFNTNSFRDYFTNIYMKLARKTEVDGFFWDEPPYKGDPNGDKGFTVQGKPAEAVMRKWCALTMK